MQMASTVHQQLMQAGFYQHGDCPATIQFSQQKQYWSRRKLAMPLRQKFLAQGSRIIEGSPWLPIMVVPQKSVLSKESASILSPVKIRGKLLKVSK
jgi:hypothetical protein